MLVVLPGLDDIVTEQVSTSGQWPDGALPPRRRQRELDVVVGGCAGGRQYWSRPLQ